jgi:glucosamine-6-phosphate deaminase
MADEVTLQRDALAVVVAASEDAMARAAADLAARRIAAAVRERGNARVAFAAAPSQTRFLEHLRADASVPWGHVEAFHLDEYLGLAADAPQRFRAYLDTHLFHRVPLARVHGLEPHGQDPEAAGRQYAARLAERALDVACIGIGENGHLAFNDPHVADFDDPDLVKVVELDHACRTQQVHDGCFARLDEVPTHALTLTLPAIHAARAIVCVVPGERKAEAVERTLDGPIGPACPATILRTHPNATLFLDDRSGRAYRQPSRRS